MADTPSAGTPAQPEPPAAPSEPAPAAPERRPHVHEVRFTAYPKLFFTWPLILLGLVFWPLSGWMAPDEVHGPPGMTPIAVSPSGEVTPAGDAAVPAQPVAAPQRPGQGRLEVLGWVYIWTAILVFLTLGVDVDRNKAVFFLVLIAAIYILGMWLHDVKGFTFFGDIYRWFASLDVQYNRSLGLALSLVLGVPFLVTLVWARVNDRWRITHNEFEHYSFGKANDSLGRGAKTIRTDFPDVFELLLGLAGTLIVFNASGTRELRRIPHIMFLPFVRRRLNQILERTAVTAGQIDEEDEEET